MTSNYYEKNQEFFRAAIFGSARTQKTEKVYMEVFDLAYQIGKKGIDVVTGGGPGVMEAANFGHKSGSDEFVKSIGLTIELPWENEGNKCLDIKKHFNTFSNRLDTFMKMSNVVIVMPGGIGTALELFYTWQLVQVGHVENTPIILHGKIWDDLVRWVKKDLLGNKYISPKDLDNVYTVDTNDEALEMITAFHDIHMQKGEEGKLVFDKYKIADFT